MCHYSSSYLQYNAQTICNELYGNKNTKYIFRDSDCFNDYYYLKYLRCSSSSDNLYECSSN